MKLAFVFPGQGSQALGMGEDFRRSFATVQKRFDQASDRLGSDLSAIIGKGPPALLAQTHLAQPAIFTLSYALGELLAARGLQPFCAAGHSLGEFSAVAAASAISFDAGLDLVIERGRLMHAVNESIDGAMLAVSGSNLDFIETVVSRANAAVWIANHNAPSQIVLSGLRADLSEISASLIASGARCTWLSVAGPYHSPLMKDAALQFATRIAATQFADPQFAVIANTNASSLCTAAAISEELSAQMLSTVRWVDSLRCIRDLKVATLIEVGPGRTLKGLALRQHPAMDCWTTGTLREFDETCRRWETLACESL
ncbi:MAG: ACP S-malonyltransferase [Candidatus Obscuribacterales bacterium]|nr:ACP S-malonyltransferase [Steroidobacteraceae bacterium]